MRVPCLFQSLRSGSLYFQRDDKPFYGFRTSLSPENLVLTAPWSVIVLEEVKTHLLSPLAGLFLRSMKYEWSPRSYLLPVFKLVFYFSQLRHVELSFSRLSTTHLIVLHFVFATVSPYELLQYSCRYRPCTRLLLSPLSPPLSNGNQHATFPFRCSYHSPPPPLWSPSVHKHPSTLRTACVEGRSLLPWPLLSFLGSLPRRVV